MPKKNSQSFSTFSLSYSIISKQRHQYNTLHESRDKTNCHLLIFHWVFSHLHQKMGNNTLCKSLGLNKLPFIGDFIVCYINIPEIEGSYVCRRKNLIMLNLNH